MISDVLLGCLALGSAHRRQFGSISGQLRNGFGLARFGVVWCQFGNTLVSILSQFRVGWGQFWYSLRPGWGEALSKGSVGCQLEFNLNQFGMSLQRVWEILRTVWNEFG